MVNHETQEMLTNESLVTEVVTNIGIRNRRHTQQIDSAIKK